MDRNNRIALVALAGLLLPSLAWASEGGLSASSLLTGIGIGWLVSAGALFVNPRLGAAVAGLMGLGVSLYLGAQHGQTGDMICSVDANFDCGAVIRSQYSAIAGIPIAFFGSGFYAAAVAAGLAAMSKPDQYRGAGRLLLGGAIFSVAYSVFLAWASTQLGKWCLFCISLYGVNVLLLIAGLLWSRASAAAAASTAEPDRSLWTMIGAGAAIFLLASVAGGVGAGNGGPIGGTEPGRQATPEQLQALYEQTEGEVVLDGTEPLLGSPDAPYTVLEFADFECPYCGMVAPELKKLIAENADVRLLYKHYPISSICNENVDREGHARACGAAMAAECARTQQRFWELSALMFKNQANLSPDEVRFMAQQVELDMAAFDACMADPMTEQAVRADVAHATSTGVHGTPSLYLKGATTEPWIRVRGGHEELSALIAAHKSGVQLLPAPPPSEP